MGIESKVESLEKELGAINEVLSPLIRERLQQKLRRKSEDYKESLEEVSLVERLSRKYQGSEKIRTESGKPAIETREGKVWTVGFASAYSGDPGNFGKLGFSFSGFYELPQEERDECLRRLNEEWHDLFNRKGLKKEKEIVENYLSYTEMEKDLILPKLDSAFELKQAYQEKLIELEQDLNLKEFRSKTSKLESIVDGLSKEYKSKLEG